MIYLEMTKQEILALPAEEQKFAWRCNPQLSSIHMDGRCSICWKRFSLDIKIIDGYRVQCPHCNKGVGLRATTQHERNMQWAMLRAQGEQRPFSLLKGKITAFQYENCLAHWKNAEEVSE